MVCTFESAISYSIAELLVLEKLDEVPWSELKHAYGPASDVPALIRGLCNSNSIKREKVIYSLYGNIFHQGTRYQATSYAIPFLFELLRAPETWKKDDIVYLLVKLALGYEEEYLPFGINVAALTNELEDADLQMSESDQLHCDEYGCGPRDVLECYRAVERGVPELLELTNDRDPQVRCAAVYSLAWFPSCAAASVPVVRKSMETETDEAAIANAVLALGLLARSTRDRACLNGCEKLLTHPVLLVRTSAAVALAEEPLSEAIIDLLTDAIVEPEGLQGLIEQIRFNDGNLAGYASLTLASFGAGARDKIVPAMCAALMRVNAYQSLDITNALLHALTNGRTTPLKDAPLVSLDEVEFAALRAIANYGGWKLGGGIFANYGNLLQSYGLPDSQERLMKFLGMDVPEEKTGRGFRFKWPWRS